jgi:hypothetical protein
MTLRPILSDSLPLSTFSDNLFFFQISKIKKAGSLAALAFCVP